MHEQITRIMFQLTLLPTDSDVMFMLLAYVGNVREAMVVAGLIDVDNTRRKVYLTERGRQLADEMIKQAENLVAKATLPEVGDLVLVAPDNFTGRVRATGESTFLVETADDAFNIQVGKLTLISRADKDVGA